MSKCKLVMKYDETLKLAECPDGFWLYDTTRGMNLSMRSPTKDDALFNALKYYQKRLNERETELKELKEKVNIFVDQFIEEPPEELY